jgi:hypothetical protein
MCAYPATNSAFTCPIQKVIIFTTCKAKTNKIPKMIRAKERKYKGLPSAEESAVIVIE